MSDLVGTAGRELLERLDIPEPWASTLARSLAHVDALDQDIGIWGRGCSGSRRLALDFAPR